MLSSRDHMLHKLSDHPNEGKYQMNTEESGIKKIKRRKHKQSSKESVKRSGIHNHGNAVVNPCESETPEPASLKINEGSQTSEETVDIVDISNKKAPQYTEQEM